MGLINQFGDELAIGDTVVHTATNRIGKIKVFFTPTGQKPPRARSGSCGLESSILRKYRLLISAPCSGKSAAAERRCD